MLACHSDEGGIFELHDERPKQRVEQEAIVVYKV
jgi:hypothetical protein